MNGTNPKRKRREWGPPCENSQPFVSSSNDCASGIDLAKRIASNITAALTAPFNSAAAQKKPISFEFDINDSYYRHILIKKQTLDDVAAQTGAHFKVRGVYQDPGAMRTGLMNTPFSEKRLHLLVTTQNDDSQPRTLSLLKGLYYTGRAVPIDENPPFISPAPMAYSHDGSTLAQGPLGSPYTVESSLYPPFNQAFQPSIVPHSLPRPPPYPSAPMPSYPPINFPAQPMVMMAPGMLIPVVPPGLTSLNPYLPLNQAVSVGASASSKNDASTEVVEVRLNQLSSPYQEALAKGLESDAGTNGSPQGPQAEQVSIGPAKSSIATSTSKKFGFVYPDTEVFIRSAEAEARTIDAQISSLDNLATVAALNSNDSDSDRNDSTALRNYGDDGKSTEHSLEVSMQLFLARRRQRVVDLPSNAKESQTQLPKVEPGMPSSPSLGEFTLASIVTTASAGPTKPNEAISAAIEESETKLREDRPRKRGFQEKVHSSVLPNRDKFQRDHPRYRSSVPTTANSSSATSGSSNARPIPTAAESCDDTKYKIFGTGTEPDYSMSRQDELTPSLSSNPGVAKSPAGTNHAMYSRSSLAATLPSHTLELPKASSSFQLKFGNGLTITEMTLTQEEYSKKYRPNPSTHHSTRSNVGSSSQADEMLHESIISIATTATTGVSTLSSILPTDTKAPIYGNQLLPGMEAYDAFDEDA